MATPTASRLSAGQLWQQAQPTVIFLTLCCSCAGIMVGLESDAELSQQQAAATNWDDLVAQTNTTNITELRALAQSVIGPRPVVKNRDWTFIGALRPRRIPCTSAAARRRPSC